MIIGIGTDIVHIPRIEALLVKHGNTIAKRILSDAELAQFQQAKLPAAFLAKRFAAKEATAKAFGSGFRDGLSLKHITVSNDASGKPELSFNGQGEQQIQQLKVSKAMLSLSDDGDYAIAYVTLVE